MEREREPAFTQIRRKHLANMLGYCMFHADMLATTNAYIRRKASAVLQYSSFAIRKSCGWK
eukprot:4804281-Prorocentrum_lima.AAC.1